MRRLIFAFSAMLIIRHYGMVQLNEIDVTLLLVCKMFIKMLILLLAVKAVYIW